MIPFPSIERYGRQMTIPTFGVAGQQKLQSAKVLMIGAGGLGCPVLQYLVAAGVGKVGIVDHDLVSLSNLHRQVLYRTEDIGKPKATVAKSTLERLNPEVEIVALADQVNSENIVDILSDYDLILDGTDNFEARYLISDACVALQKTLIFGAVSQFEGQVAVFNALQKDGTRGANYRDVFPDPPGENEVRNCAEAGVLGVLPGIIGAMMANEAIKWITGVGQPMSNRILTYNALNNQTYEVMIL